jgi:hypothetical protein
MLHISQTTIAIIIMIASIYILLAYLFQGIPWLLSFRKHNWKDNLVTAAGCSVFPFTWPFIVASYVGWKIIKVLFAIALVLFLIPAYTIYWVAERLLGGGTLFKIWFEVARGFLQFYIEIMNTITFLPQLPQFIIQQFGLQVAEGQVIELAGDSSTDAPPPSKKKRKGK